MRNEGVDPKQPREQATKEPPVPTAQFRRRAWLTFQRALDPLGPPKPLRLPRH